MAKATQNLIIGVGGHAVAIDHATGAELWRTKLKSNSYVTTVWSSAGRVYAGAAGELFCLDAHTGAVLWHNRLKGLGTGIVAFSTSSDIVSGAAAAAAVAATG
ncbi:MAG: PQQ-binding-like beta-propeller repeat protein [Gemmatimonadales bacterium]|nr:PQQ-binding-like beta-propeller repeat protein [Gemmatimonadales bacterium]